jgi:uncharacterized membrane-anchored protein YjiN (DUF445 family)
MKPLQPSPYSLATLLLIVMGVGFIGAGLLSATHPAMAWVRAFCEAGLVGAMADWFAVVALFRHPLGLPLPHTAIIPAQQRKMGRTLAHFMVGNFLSREVVEPWLERIDFAHTTGQFLKQKSGLLARSCVRAIPKILAAFDQSQIASLILSQTRALLQKVPLAPALGEILSLTTKDNLHEAALNHILQLADELIRSNQSLIRDEIAKELPLPDLPVVRTLRDVIAAYAAERTVTRVKSTLSSAAGDPNHTLRVQFRAWLHREIEQLKGSPAYHAKGESIKARLLGDPAVGHYAEVLWQSIRERLIADCEAPESRIEGALADFCAGIGAALDGNAELQAPLNHELREGILSILERHQEAIRSLIEETMGAWKSEHLVAKVEEAVGNDLQYIRINGTLVGGTIGLALHYVGTLLRF